MENCSADPKVGGDDARETISGQFDWSETPPSVAAVRLMSVALDCDPTAVDPLGQSVDPDALDRLVLSAGTEASVEFTHLDLSVCLYGDGTTLVQPDGR